MPSDPRVAPAIAALRPRIDAFRSAVVAAHERARGLLSVDGSTSRVAGELGAFGSARIDLDRFAAIDAGHPALDAASRATIIRAADVLRELSSVDDSAFVLDVPAGGSLLEHVSAALGRFGRAFGAANVVELIRSGRYSMAEHRQLEFHPFDKWGRGERSVAPPLVILVDGADLRSAPLADLLDGSVHFAFFVRGACTPAPLSRLITPGILVGQSNDAGILPRLASWDGPAIMAIVPDTAARFVHDPAAGKGAWQRLAVSFRAEAPKRTVGRWSVAQQREELLQLEVLATPPSLGDTPIEALAPGKGGDPVDRLASWLLTASGQAM